MWYCGVSHQCSKKWNAVLLSRGDMWAEDCALNAFNVPHTTASGSGSWCVSALFCKTIRFCHSFVLDWRHTAVWQSCSTADQMPMGWEGSVSYEVFLTEPQGLLPAQVLMPVWPSRLIFCVTRVKDAPIRLSTQAHSFCLSACVFLERLIQSSLKRLPTNLPRL